jgi:hypothetical protein
VRRDPVSVTPRLVTVTIFLASTLVKAPTRAADALRYAESDGVAGKVVLVPADS